MEQSILPSRDINKYAIPVRMGVIIGIVSCVLTTINFMFMVDNYIMFMAFYLIVFVATIVLYWLTGKQQRTAMGGYIDVKQAFQAIFIAILISSIIASIYGFIYAKYIDPEVINRIKESTIGFMERVGAPEAKINETAETIDKTAEDSKHPGRLLYAFAKGLVISSIFGFICALIVKKKKPEFMD